MPLVALVRLGRVSGNGLVKRVCKPNVSVWPKPPSVIPAEKSAGVRDGMEASTFSGEDQAGKVGGLDQSMGPPIFPVVRSYARTLKPFPFVVYPRLASNNQSRHDDKATGRFQNATLGKIGLCHSRTCCRAARLARWLEALLGITSSTAIGRRRTGREPSGLYSGGGRTRRQDGQGRRHCHPR